MWSSRILEQQIFPDHKTMLMAREATELLHDQERLLDVPMSPADMLLYEIRSQQIRDLIQQLSENNPAGSLSRIL